MCGDDKSLYIFWDERLQGWWRHTKHNLMVVKYNILFSSSTELNKGKSFKTALLAVVLMHPVIIFSSVVWAESKSKASDWEQVS